jgi:hypothetical protein
MVLLLVVACGAKGVPDNIPTVQHKFAMSQVIAEQYANKRLTLNRLTRYWL